MLPTKYTEFVRFLRKEGYRETNTDLIESGTVRIQGDVVTVWPAGTAAQLRFHFLGEVLERWESWQETAWKPGEGELPDLLPNTLQSEHGDIRPGEYIVHPHHGVGIFEGIVRQRSADTEGLFIALIYAGNDRLLVPLERQQELMPYIGTRHPRLTRLYSKAWLRTKERVQKDLIKVARGLLQIFAARQLHTRTPYPVAQDWIDILDRSAGFQLTDDQVRALKEIGEDLGESNLPMDRLLCGDVGFGKTEVALRAAAQVMAAGKQVALLAPTTVLAEQHYALLKDRLAALPVNIGRLSRLTKGGDVSTIAKIREGGLDLVVGTHRLLGKDIEWKDLGLLIIDEEQKFGVAQKERLKGLRPTVDVLSLSATPIPRTLSMSLSGLRSLSILRRAPEGRLPVKTEVGEYSDQKLQEVLTAELKRGGQTYVVLNRVLPLPGVVERVRSLLTKAGFPQARIGMAHGQLAELELADTMGKFMGGELDILVASTIVEHGLDSPHANTLVVLHSEHFGLADLYQLRGRVGRRTQQAFAYFLLGGVEHQQGYEIDDERREAWLEGGIGTVPVTGIAVTHTARQRLHALLEADELGSGWSIALRDLEIRGGGNILGNEQHGSLESVGLLLYAQLLQEEIGRQAVRQGIKLFQKSEV